MMSFQYALLIVGRKRGFREVQCAIPCDGHGNELPVIGDDDAFYKYGTKKVVDYEIINNCMYCYLDVGS